jgi:hypothetical protein
MGPDTPNFEEKLMLWMVSKVSLSSEVVSQDLN